MPTSRLPKIGTTQKPPQWRDIGESRGDAGINSSLFYRLLRVLGRDKSGTLAQCEVSEEG
jgi:hypothetical protein